MNNSTRFLHLYVSKDGWVIAEDAIIAFKYIGADFAVADVSGETHLLTDESRDEFLDRAGVKL